MIDKKLSVQKKRIQCGCNLWDNLVDSYQFFKTTNQGMENWVFS